MVQTADPTVSIDTVDIDENGYLTLSGETENFHQEPTFTFSARTAGGLANIYLLTVDTITFTDGEWTAVIDLHQLGSGRYAVTVLAEIPAVTQTPIEAEDTFGDNEGETAYPPYIDPGPQPADGGGIEWHG